MDQPLAALEVFRTGLDFFPGNANGFRKLQKFTYKSTFLQINYDK